MPSNHYILPSGLTYSQFLLYVVSITEDNPKESKTKYICSNCNMILTYSPEYAKFCQKLLRSVQNKITRYCEKTGRDPRLERPTLSTVFDDYHTPDTRKKWLTALANLNTGK